MKNKLLLLVMMCVMTITVFAMPARKGGVIVTQPDGTELTIYQHGDEHFHWVTNENGDWLTKTEDGFYKVTDSLTTDKIIARRKASPRQIQRSSTLNIAPRGLIILVNFKDLSFSTSKEDMVDMLTGVDYTRDYTYVRGSRTYEVHSKGSARQYFFDASNGQYNPQFDVFGPVTVSQNMAYYGGNDYYGNDLHPELMVAEACELADGSVDFSQYDNDGDGVVDFVYVFYAGFGEADGGDANTIWPHQWAVSVTTNLRLDGKKIDTYACSNELDFRTKVHTGIGTFCHEFSHVLGLPDMYATDGSTHKTLGNWSIMDYGSYNNESNTPPTYSAYERFFMGWLTPRLITESENVVLEDLSISNEALLISSTDKHNLIGNNPNPTTFYLLENRQQLGWDEYLSGHGLMLTKIQYNSNKWYQNIVNNNAYSMGVDLIEADGNDSGNPKASDLFPAGATEYTGIANHPIKHIREKNGAITFSYKNAIPDSNDEPDDEYKLLYSSSDGNIVTPYKTDVFGANIVSNTMINGQCVITFDAPITNIGDSAFYNCKKLTSITIPDGVTNIGEYAFSYSYVSSITIPESVTNIGESAFDHCSMTSITIPNSVTYIGGYAFSYCTKLNSVTLPNSITSIEDGTFGICKSLTSITIPNSVTSIGKKAFEDCSSLTSITIPNSVTNIGDYAFRYCSSLEGITIPISVDSLGSSVFRGCSSLSSVIWNAEDCVSTSASLFTNCNINSFIFGDNVKSIPNSLCSGLSNLTTITIPSSVESIGNFAFRNCSSLTSLVIPANVIEIGGYAFAGCSSIASITCNADTIPSIARSTFNDVDKNIPLYVPCGTLEAYKSAYGWKEFTNIQEPQTEYSIIVSSSDDNHGTVSVDKNTACETIISATPADGYMFTQWSDGNKDNPRTLTLTQDTELVAEFTAQIDSTYYIYYTSTDGNIVTPYKTDVFGANIVNNTYENGQGVITFDGPVTSIGDWAFIETKNLKTMKLPNSVTIIGENAFYECESLTSIIIPNSVKDIDAYAFGNCSSLSSLTMPTNITAIKRSVFDGCSSLTLIEIPHSVTSIESEAFANCSKIESITIYNGLTSIGDNAFRYCSALKSITIPNSVVKIEHSLFFGCTSLSSIAVETGNQIYDSRNNCNAIIETSTNTLIAGCKATIIPNDIVSIGEDAFVYCHSLSSIEIPNGVINIGEDAFCNCGLKSIFIPSSVRNIEGNTFVYCDYLSSIVVDADNKVYDSRNNCNAIMETSTNRLIVGCKNTVIPSNTKIIGSMAFQTGGILYDTIVIPDGVTSIEDQAFYLCEKLSKVYLPASLSFIGKNVFSGCDSLKVVHVNATIPPTLGENVFKDSSPTCYIPCGTLAAYQASDWANQVGELVEEECEEIVPDSTHYIYYTSTNGNIVTPYATDVFGANIISNTYENGQGVITFDGPVTSIGINAFRDCLSIISITIPNSVTSLGTSAFYGCSSLASITIPNSVTSIDGYAFYNCSSLASITIPNSVTTIGDYAFYNCSSIVSVSIPNSVTHIANRAFCHCTSLSSINIESGNSTYDSRNNCNAIIETATNTLIAGCKNTIIPNSVTSIDEYAFYNCSSLVSIDIPNSVISIGEYAFYNCSSLATVTISESVTSIEELAFNSCKSLMSIIIADGNSIYDSRSNCNAIIETATNTLIAGCKNTIIPNGVTTIGKWAFYKCSSLTSITIPISVTNIEYKAFRDCDSLNTIYIKATTPPSLDITDMYTTICSTCYIPCGTLAAYQASDWDGRVGTFVEETCENIVPDSTYCIFYTSYDGNIVNPEVYDTDIFNVFGANIISNTYENGVGTITFDRPLTTIGDNAFGFSGYYLTSIKLPNTVTSIGSGAFWGCSYLTEFTIPENVTTIGRDAFSSCEALTEITIPKSVTSIEPQIFNRCPSLIKITIEEGNEKYDSRDNCNAIIETATNKLIEGCKTTIIPNTVTSIGESAFSGCENLSSITIPNSVTSIEVWAFASCYALDAVFIDAIMPPTLIYNYTLYKYQVFSGKYPTCYVPCGTLAAYQASDWAKEGVTLQEKTCENNIPINQIQYTSSDGNVITPNIGYMTEFDAFGANIVSNTYENGVGTITFDGAVSRIGYQSFSNSETLTSITLPDSISTIDFEAFRNCDRLKLVTIPNSVYGIWDYAFGECDSLVAVNIPASVEYIGSNAFNGCYQLASVEISEGLRQIGDYAFSGCSKLTSLSLPSTLQYLGQSAFSGCGFSTFTIPTGLTTIPAYLFMYCQNLQSVTIPENITAIEDGAFSTCLKLTSIDIPNSVTSIGFGAFYGAGICSIVLPENITTINENTFYGCANLASITIPNKVTTIKESAFSGCKNMKSVLFSNSLTSIEGNAFYDCMSLEALYIPKSVTSISNYAFSNCESLQSIVVENGNSIYDSRNSCNAIIETATNTLISGCQTTIIPKDVISVGDYAFVGQKKLTTIAFPSSVAKIGVRAFDNCSNLKTIIFGNQVDSIAQRAFENCLAIDDIYSYSLQPPVLSENALAYYDANLYVPCSALADYQVADKWNQFTYVQCIDTMYFNITNDTVRPYTVEVTYGDILYAGDVFIPALVMIDDEVYHVTSIGDSAFYDCSSLTSVSIPESVVSVDPNAFTNCTSFDTITIKATTPPTLDNSGISSNPVCKIPCHTQSVYEASNWNNHVKNFEEQCDGYYIYYTSTDGNVVRPYKTDVFHAKIISNKYENGVGVITFDKPVTRIGEMAFTSCRELASITIPNTVLKIDKKAFYSCSSLADVTIGTCVQDIADESFRYCSSITSIVVPNSVTTIGKNAFANCKTLTSINIPNNITTIAEGVFHYCSSITSLVLPNGVTTIGKNAFASCSSLIDIKIPHNVSSIGGGAFSGCSVLSSIEIPNSVVYLGSGAFSGCTSITSVTIPNSIDTLASSVFSSCTSLSSIYLPNSITIIENSAFKKCSSISSIDLPNSVKKIGDSSFNGCSSLTTITIPDSVTRIGEFAFYDCPTLTTVSLPQGIEDIDWAAFSGETSLDTIYCYRPTPLPLRSYPGTVFSHYDAILFVPCEALSLYQSDKEWGKFTNIQCLPTEDLIPTNQIQYTTWDDEIVRIDTTYHIDYNYGVVNYYSMFGANIISNTYENGVGTITFDAPVTTIGSRVFNHSNLRTIILPNNISTIQDDAFADCGSLESITLPRNLKSIGYGAFRMCSHLQSIEFPEGLESIEGRAFENCFNGMGYYATGGSFMDPNEGYIGYGLSISIPSSVTSIGEGVFAWCSGISSIVVDGNNTTYDSREDCHAIVETATNTMIAGCRNSFIPATVTALGYGVFYGHSIKSINIPDGVVSIGESAFAYSDIETLHVPGSVKTIGRDAFNHCDELTTLTISEGLETIEYCGIYCCYALKSIVFPSTLKSIGGYGVSACSSMTSVEFLSTTPPTINNDFYGCFWDTPCEFTVPCGTKDAYYTALNADAPSGYHIDSLKVKEKEVFAYSIVSGDIEQGLVFITKHATYCDDQTLSFYAEPTEGSSFVKWSDGCTDKERNITLTQDTTIVAEFSSMNCVIASGTCGINGDNLMWQLSCDSILSIMGEGEMSEYSYGDHGINPPWTEYASQIKSIVVKEGVTSIGTYAFYNYSTAKYNSLKDITIPTSLTKTGGNVFSGLTSMNAVYITDLEAWMNISHSNSNGNPLCSAHHLYVNGVELEELVLPEGTTSVSEYVFYGCKGLKSLQLPNSIELIENSAFAGTGLIDLVLPEGLEVVDNSAFNGCLSLEKLYISSTVRRLGNCAFEGCDSLKGVYITDLEAWCNLTIEYSSPLTDAHHLYLNDIELTEVVFPENCSVVKNYTFEGCSYIKSIQLHDNITSIGSFAFHGCSSLESLVIPASVSYIGSCQFWDCTALKQIKFLSSTPPEISQGAVVFYRTNTDIIVPCGSKDEYIAVINSPDQELYWIDTNRIIEQQAYTYSIITSNPSQGSIYYLHEPANCNDLTLSFRADAANGYRFVRWSDGNTENPRTLLLTQDTYLTAEFETSVCNVNVWCDATRGFVIGNGAYSYGTTVTLSAHANEGYRFARWSDNITENPRTITLYHDMTLRADFMECSETDLTICERELPHLWYDQTLTATGKYTYTEKYVGTDIDSIQHILNLTVNPTVYTEETMVACDSYTWNGETYTESGEYVYTTTAANGCDSIITLRLTINPTKHTEETAVACDSYSWNGQTYTESGDYTYITVAANGCDSIVTLHLTINNSEIGATEYVTICYGDTYTWNGQTYSTEGEYSITLSNTLGCDSVATLQLTIMPEATTTTETVVIGSDELPYTWRGNTYSATGRYTVIEQYTTVACDSAIHVLDLTVLTTGNHDEQSVTICETEAPYTWYGESYFATGKYTYTEKYAGTDIDSIRHILNLTVNPTVYSEETMVACDSYTWNGETYTESGEYVYNTTASNGCDSIVTLHLTINQPQYAEETAVACDSYTWNGETYTQSGEYVYTTTAANGCDSIVTLHLTINQTQYAEESVTACDSYAWNGQTYTESGEYVYNTTASNGCDSIVTLHLTINQTQYAEESVTACDSYVWNGQTYTESGEYVYNTTAANGCDSIVTLHLTINQTQYAEESVTACDSYTWNGQTYTESGEYVYNTTASNGCDSIVTLHLTINQTQYAEVIATACDSYTWNGETYTESGEYVYTTTSANGCDSIVTLHLTINNTQYAEESVVACDSYTWNGETYTENGEYVYTTTATNGCDSIVTLHLTINNSEIGETEYATICHGETYIWNGVAYAESGEYSVTLSNTFGCDSIATLHLTIMPAAITTTETVVVGNDELPYVWRGNTYSATGQYIDVEQYTHVACDSAIHVLDLTVLTTGALDEQSVTICETEAPYIWYGESYSTTGKYTYTEQYVGTDIDSIQHILNLTVNPTVYVEEYITACNNYTWNGETYTASGEYVYTTTAANGCDSIVTLHLTINQTQYAEKTVTACDSYTWNGETYITSGEYVYTSTVANGCDSIITLHLTINKSEYVEETVTACDSYEWNGVVYTESGDYTYTTTAANGCDSIVTLHLTINNSEIGETEYATICYGETYTWNGQTYLTEGEYSITLSNTLGCDSVATLQLTIMPEAVTTTETVVIGSDELPYTWRGNTYSATGRYTVVEQYTTVACDSAIRVLDLTVLSTGNYDEQSVTICETEAPYIWYGDSYSATGKYTYTEKYVGTDIDSIQHILNLTVNPTVYTEETITACDSYEWNGQTYTQSGDYVYTTVAANGCDSIVTLHLTINNSEVAATEYATICHGETYIWNGVAYAESGEYSVTLSNTLGCDSIATLHLTIMPAAITTTETVVVGSDELPYVWRGNTYSATGRYTDVEQYTHVACDSAIHVLDLTVLTTGALDEQSVTICETEAPYTWYGKSYSTTGKYTYTEQYAGTDIDSIQHILNLTVNPTVYTEETITACDSYTWNGETYTKSGDYVYTTTAANGCDSIVTLHLTINQSEHVEFSMTACDSYEWHGMTYTISGDYTYTTTTDQGCERVEVLHLTINKSEYVEESVTACDSYDWNGVVYTESGDYTYNTTTEQGCERVEVLHLTINKSEYVEESVTACDSYEWHGMTYTTSGDYTYTTTTDQGCERVEVLHLTINKSEYVEESVTACDSYEWHGIVYTESGNYTYNTTTDQGCERVEVLHLTINKSEYVEESVTACDSYEWHGMTYTISGDYTYTTTTDQGCERVEVLHLTILPDAMTESEELALCPSELPYEWYGQWLTEAGSYTATEQYAGMECDSVIHELIVNVYVQTLPVVVFLPIVRTGEAIDVTIPTAEIQAHIAAETWYAPNAEVAWYIMESSDWAALTTEPVAAGTTQVVLKYAVATDCGSVESDNIVIDVIPTSVENTHTQSPTSDCQKILYEDHILILRDGKIYSIMGQEM